MKASGPTPATTSAAVAPLSIQEHLALGNMVHEARNSYLNPIPEERFKRRIARVAEQVFKAIVSAAQLRRPAKEPSLTKITFDVLAAKGQDAIGPYNRLMSSSIGREALLRVVHAVSLSALQNYTKLQLPPVSALHPDQSPQPVPTLSEIHSSAYLFAAQPLHDELSREDPYRAGR